MRRVKELDGLRAIAILLVLGCHYEGFATLLGGLPQVGWIGVDIFFVLSGFLITAVLLRLRNSAGAYKTFYSRRLIRILPPYAVVTTLVVLICVVLPRYSVLSWNFIIEQVFFLQAFTENQALFLKDLFTEPGTVLARSADLMLHAHHLPKGYSGLSLTLLAPSLTYWSLSIEEYFYLAWAPVVLKLRRKNIALTGIGVCLLEMILRWLYPDWLSYFEILFRFDALIYGAFLALVIEYLQTNLNPSQSRGWFVTVFAICLVALTSILFLIRPVIGYEIRQSPLFRVFGLPLVSIATAAVIGYVAVFSDSQKWLPRFLRTRFMQYIGTISYTMYLVHALVAAVLAMSMEGLLRRLHLDGAQPHGLMLGEAIVSSAATIVIARLSWHYLEAPMLRWKDRRFPDTKTSEPTLS